MAKGRNIYRYNLPLLAGSGCTKIKKERKRMKERERETRVGTIILRSKPSGIREYFIAHSVPSCKIFVRCAPCVGITYICCVRSLRTKTYSTVDWFRQSRKRVTLPQNFHLIKTLSFIVYICRGMVWYMCGTVSGGQWTAKWILAFRFYGVNFQREVYRIKIEKSKI